VGGSIPSRGTMMWKNGIPPKEVGKEFLVEIVENGWISHEVIAWGEASQLFLNRYGMICERVFIQRYIDLDDLTAG
jgi:hypothetical protein